jgi:hypothetical protein
MFAITPRASKRKLSRVSWGLLLVSAIFSSGCAQDLKGKGAGSTDGTVTKDTTVDKALSLEWGDSPEDGGELIATGLAQSKVEAIDGARRAFCFDNLLYSDSSQNCKRSSTAITSKVHNNPVAIQGFELNFSRLSGQSVVIKKANFTTALPVVNTETGLMEFQHRTTWDFETSSGGAIHKDCDPSAANSVGYTSPEGAEKVLTGLQVFDTATYFTALGAYGSARLQAGRVWVSGFFPEPTTGGDFNFKMIPSTVGTAGEQVDFGYYDFNPVNADGVTVSPHFGLKENPFKNSADATAKALWEGMWPYHVIVGFCIEGTKTGGSEGTRPLVLRSVSRVFDTIRLQDVTDDTEESLQ